MPCEIIIRISKRICFVLSLPFNLKLYLKRKYKEQRIRINAINLYIEKLSPKKSTPHIHGIIKLAEPHTLTSIYASVLKAKIQATQNIVIEVPAIMQITASGNVIVNICGICLSKTNNSANIKHEKPLSVLNRIASCIVCIVSLTRFDE